MKTLVICLVVIAAVAANEYDFQATGNVRSDVRPDGSYEYAYDTSNGISAQESGVGGVSAQGAAKWSAPDGTPIEFSYVADENGYRAEGPFVPQVPDYVVRLVDYLRTHAPKDDQLQIHRRQKRSFKTLPTKGFVDQQTNHRQKRNLKKKPTNN